MGVYHSGSQSQIVLGLQNTFNTMPATPVGFIIRKSRFTFGNYNDLIADDELRADPNPAQQETGLNRVGASLVAPMTTEEFGMFCYLFLGGYSVTGAADPYAHEFVIDATEPLIVWLECGDLKTTKYDLAEGLVISSISLGTINKSSNMMNVTIQFEASGKFTRNGAAPQDAAPTAYSVRKHTQAMHKILIDDTLTALITETSWTISRTITMLSVSDGTLYHTGFDYGDYSYDFTIQGFRAAADTIVGYDDGAEHGVEILSERPGSATHYVNIDHNETLIKNSETPGEISGDPPVPQKVRVLPTYINHADGSSILITVETEIADYVALMVAV